MHPRHLLYLLIYIFTGAANSLLVKRSQLTLPDGTHRYAYEPVAVTFCVTLSKLLLTSLYVLFFQHPSTPPLATLSALRPKLPLMRLFLIPAALYFVFDTLAFFNLKLVQPATFRLLINLKVLFSGVLLYVIIGQRLSSRQWLALVILVLACGVEQMDSFDVHTGAFAIAMICLQALMSSTAGCTSSTSCRPSAAAPTRSACGRRTSSSTPGPSPSTSSTSASSRRTSSCTRWRPRPPSTSTCCPSC